MTNQTTLTVRYAVSNETYRTKRALNVAEMFSCAQRIVQRKDL